MKIIKLFFLLCLISTSIFPLTDGYLIHLSEQGKKELLEKSLLCEEENTKLTPFGIAVSLLCAQNHSTLETIISTLCSAWRNNKIFTFDDIVTNLLFDLQKNIYCNYDSKKVNIIMILIIKHIRTDLQKSIITTSNLKKSPDASLVYLSKRANYKVIEKFCKNKAFKLTPFGIATALICAPNIRTQETIITNLSRMWHNHPRIFSFNNVVTELLVAREQSIECDETRNIINKAFLFIIKYVRMHFQKKPTLSLENRKKCLEILLYDYYDKNVLSIFWVKRVFSPSYIIGYFALQEDPEMVHLIKSELNTTKINAKVLLLVAKKNIYMTRYLLDNFNFERKELIEVKNNTQVPKETQSLIASYIPKKQNKPKNNWLKFFFN